MLSNNPPQKNKKNPQIAGKTYQLYFFILSYKDNSRVSIETISAQFDVSVGTVHTIIHEELKMRKICTKFVPRVLREDQKERQTLSWQQGDGWADQFRSRSSWCSSDLRWKLDLLLWPRDRVPSGSMLALPDPRRPDRANPPTNFWWSLFFDSTGMIYIHWVPTRQTVNEEYYVEVLRDFRKRFRRKRPALFKLGQWHFHQSTTPSLSQTIWPRWASTQILTLPIVQMLLPVTFGYSLSSRKNLEAVVMRQLRRWKRLWRRSLTRSHKRTSMEPSRSCWNGTTSILQPEEITLKGTRVLCAYYQ